MLKTEKSPNLPSSDEAKRIAVLFNRKLTTSWSEKEIKAFKILVKDRLLTNIDDLLLLENYYKSERKKGDKGVHRRDLLTFLNNFNGELDRARAWKRPQEKEYDPPEPFWRKPNELSEEQIEKNKVFIAQELMKLREHFRMPGAAL